MKAIVENYVIYYAGKMIAIMPTMRKAKNYVRKSKIENLEIWKDIGYVGFGGQISIERVG